MRPDTIAGMSLSRTVAVQIEPNPYNVTIQPGLLADAGKLLRSISRTDKAAIITDSRVTAFHAQPLADSLEKVGIESVLVIIPAGESHKTLPHLLPVYDRLLASRIERSTPVIALGGGVIGDMAGFVAATILRGVPFIQMPTTLLAMVDASVGGKTGVDHSMGKNLIGAFYQPKAVFADPSLLGTLPMPELRSGLAECIKHDLIRDADHFKKLAKILPAALTLDPKALTDLIAHNVEIKARVVAADPHERGERAHLNLGHTFGHAIETVSNFSYSHGEAVSLGVVAATYVSEKLGWLNEDDREAILQTLQLAGLPTGKLTIDGSAVYQAMKSDKKVQDGQIRLVLLEQIGKVVVRQNVPEATIREAIESLRE